MPAPALHIQNVYAELLDRAATGAFEDAFAGAGDFVGKTVKGRKYWYFQSTTAEGRSQKYVGPESPELLERIARHREKRSDLQERRTLVSTLIRSFGLPRPAPEMGEVVKVLAEAGVFRLRGVLIGTVAFQTYAAALGAPLKAAPLRTDDVDIAQFANVSVAVDEQVGPMIDVLKKANESFRPVPHFVDGRKITAYQAKGKLRVDFLTPLVGPDNGKPQDLPALQTSAEPLRFLDFLIYSPEPAVVLHDAGIPVLVPSPQRFAIHKLIVSRRRQAANPKRDKDMQQAEALIEILAEKRPFELAEAWREACARGRTWRQLLLEALSAAEAAVRDMLLKVVEEPRSILPKLDLTFANPPERYDFDRDIVVFEGRETFGGRIACSVSREALEDHFGADGLDRNGRIECFRRNRTAIENMLRVKYMSWPVEDAGAVLLKTMDVLKLRSL